MQKFSPFETGTASLIQPVGNTHAYPVEWATYRMLHMEYGGRAGKDELETADRPGKEHGIL